MPTSTKPSQSDLSTTYRHAEPADNLPSTAIASRGAAMIGMQSKNMQTYHAVSTELGGAAGTPTYGTEDQRSSDPCLVWPALRTTITTYSEPHTEGGLTVPTSAPLYAVRPARAPTSPHKYAPAVILRGRTVRK